MKPPENAMDTDAHQGVGEMSNQLEEDIVIQLEVGTAEDGKVKEHGEVNAVNSKDAKEKEVKAKHIKAWEVNENDVKGKDIIDDVSIKLGAQTEGQWTRACKCVLINLKWLTSAQDL